jgi:hypothetical protein
MGAKNSPLFFDTPENISKYGEDLPLTDDWPYLYLQKPTVAPVYQYLFVFLALLIGSALLVLRRVHRATGWHGDFLFLGLGFTLMESAAIVRLALLFGSTWVTNAVVFAGVLLTIFLANLLCMTTSRPSIKYAWAGLFAMILLNYFFPVHLLAGVSVPLRILSSIALIGLPVFCAAICFSTLFDREAVTGYPLGVNLIGAMSGGVVEYLSMAIGMRAIWLIVLFVYLLAMLCSHRSSAQSGVISVSYS